MIRKIAIAMAVPFALTGCVGTAVRVVKAPFQVAGKAVDWTTTSQDEADRNLGRRMRRQAARENRERRAMRKTCRKNPADCADRDGGGGDDAKR